MSVARATASGQVSFGAETRCLLEPRRRGDPTTGDLEQPAGACTAAAAAWEEGWRASLWVFGGPLPVISRDDGGPVPAAAAPPVAGGNPFSLDMSSQAARPPGPYLRSGRSTNAELQRSDDGDGLLGERAAVPVNPSDLGRTAQRVAGARDLSALSFCCSCCCHAEALADLLAAHVPSLFVLGVAPEGNGGSCGPLE